MQEYYFKVREGADDIALADHDFGTFARTLKATDRIRLALKPKEVQAREVILLFGSTGTGKTKWCHDNYPDLFEMPVADKLWMDGYQGQQTVLIDEFTGQMPLNNLLKMLDPHYIRKYEIKGGFVWFNPTTILVTSNNHPSTWYKYQDRKEQEAALRRRFSRIYHYRTFRGAKSIHIYGNDVNEEDTRSRIWPIPEVDQPQVDPARIDPHYLPSQWARANGVLCNACNIYPCQCPPPQRVDNLLRAAFPTEARTEPESMPIEVQAPEPLRMYCRSCGPLCICASLDHTPLDV